MKLTIFLLLFNITNTDTIPSTPQLQHSLETYYLQKTQAEIEEYRDKKRWSWLKFVPSIGINTDFGIRPNLQFSFANMYGLLNDQNKKELKIKSLIKRNELAFNADLLKLHRLLLKRQLAMQDLQHARELLHLDEAIFKIQEDKYDRAELLPTQYLSLKKSILQQRYSIVLKLQAIELLRLEILELARYYTPLSLKIQG